MKRAAGDLWTYWPPSATEIFRVIPVNCGFNDRGLSIMGAGVAADAARRAPGLRGVWGLHCRNAAQCGVLPDLYIDWTAHFILFPTKGRNDENPALSWRAPATLELVERSAQRLAEVAMRRLPYGAHVLLPLVGCGLGQLRREDVLPILDRHLTDDRFTLVEESVARRLARPFRGGL